MTRFALVAVAALTIARSASAQQVEARERATEVIKDEDVLAPNLFKGIQAVEWTATLAGGSFQSSLPKDGAESLEMTLGIGWRNFTMGLRGSMDFMGKASGYGLGVTLGPRLHLGRGFRLELLADLGLTTFSDDYEADALLVSKKTEGSSKTLPTVGLRSGITLVSDSGRHAITLGGLVRRTNSATVEYQTTTCLVMGAICGTETLTATYGGTMVGAYLTYTHLWPRGS